jgi:hypothetical protein
MVCPNCGAQIDGQGKFCANCGAHLPEAPVAAQPPSFAAQFDAPPPPPYGAPQYVGPQPPQYGGPPQPYAPQQYGGPQYGAPPQQYGAPPQPYGTPQQPYGAPPQPYGAPPQPYGAPQYGGAQWGPPAAATRVGGSAPIAGLLATLGGVVALASAWLPFTSGLGTTSALIDATDTKTLACGYYLVAGGVIAAVCGLLLLRRSVGPSANHLLFGLGAIAAGILVVAVDFVAWRQVQDLLDAMSTFGGSDGISFGIGLFAGVGAGILSALGGLLALSGRR